jgi:Mrp family chromosome partitioning ATPase
MIVEKAVKMADLMKIPVIALAENMAYFLCPDCGKKHSIFGESHIEEIAKAYNVDTVAQIPITNKLAAAVDAGAIELFEGDWLEKLADKIENL